MNKFLLVLFCLMGMGLGIKAQKQVVDKVVAVVGGDIILSSDLDNGYKEHLAQGGPDNSDVKCYFLQQLLTQKLLKQQAAIDSIEVSESEVDDEIENRMRMFTRKYGGQERLEQMLNKTILQYKDEIRPNMKEGLISQKMRGQITKDVQVTPLEVKTYFESLKDSVPEFGTEVEVGEIVLYPKLSKEEKQKYYDKAESLRLRVKSGEDFAFLAKSYSEDPGTAADGGDLGFFDRSAMAKEFTSWAFKLKAGEMSPVFETTFGYHFLQVLERRGENVHARHMLIIPKHTPESMSRIKQQADTIYRDIKNNKITFSNAASLYSDNEDTKYSGGMILFSENVAVRTTTIPVDKLDPNIFLVVDTMKVGEVSTPVKFTGQDGKSGYRILTLRSKIPPHKANLDQDYQKIREAAQTDKISIVLSKWFEKRRESTYIKIDNDYKNSCKELKVWDKSENKEPK